MRVVITDAAYADLRGIGLVIAADNPARAETFLQDVLSRCNQLASMPRAFPLVPAWEALGIRRRPFRDYLIFYRVNDKAVEVLRILHGARDIDALLFPAGSPGDEP
jgi:plasmid stabilization system protein ParE